jgi:Cof subfamily protein (haloacid dehalogenase superfamily)
VDVGLLPDLVVPGGRFADWRPARPAYVVCDVDGTLIGPRAVSSPGVAAAFGRAREAGLRVGFATGRSRDAVAELHDQLGGDGPHVLHNGAEVRLGGATLAAWHLTVPQVDGLLAIARGRRDAYVEIYLEVGFYASSRDERARPHWEILGSEPLAEVDQAAQIGDASVMKATFAVFDARGVDAIETGVADLGLLAGTAGSPRTPGIVYVNATHPEADKGRGIVHAARHLGLGLDEVVAIGDASNDRSMLEVAGTAIAMGQAPEEIRALAHLVVPDVADDGAAVALDAAIAWRRA